MYRIVGLLKVPKAVDSYVLLDLSKYTLNPISKDMILAYKDSIVNIEVTEKGPKVSDCAESKLPVYDNGGNVVINKGLIVLSQVIKDGERGFRVYNCEDVHSKPKLLKEKELLKLAHNAKQSGNENYLINAKLVMYSDNLLEANIVSKKGDLPIEVLDANKQNDRTPKLKDTKKAIENKRHLEKIEKKFKKAVLYYNNFNNFFRYPDKYVKKYDRDLRRNIPTLEGEKRFNAKFKKDCNILVREYISKINPELVKAVKGSNVSDVDLTIISMHYLNSVLIGKIPYERDFAALYEGYRKAPNLITKEMYPIAKELGYTDLSKFIKIVLLHYKYDSGVMYYLKSNPKLLSTKYRNFYKSKTFNAVYSRYNKTQIKQLNEMFPDMNTISNDIVKEMKELSLNSTLYKLLRVSSNYRIEKSSKLKKESIYIDVNPKFINGVCNLVGENKSYVISDILDEIPNMSKLEITNLGEVLYTSLIIDSKRHVYNYALEDFDYDRHYIVLGLVLSACMGKYSEGVNVFKTYYNNQHVDILPFLDRFLIASKSELSQVIADKGLQFYLSTGLKFKSTQLLKGSSWSGESKPPKLLYDLMSNLNSFYSNNFEDAANFDFALSSVYKML